MIWPAIVQNFQVKPTEADKEEDYIQRNIDATRTAYGIAGLLQRRGKRIVPIHPDARTVHGEKGYATLADVPFEIDVVDVFRRSSAAGEFADQAVQVGAKGVWFQLGVIDEDAYRRTTDAGVRMVMDTCPAMEWPRLARTA